MATTKREEVLTPAALAREINEGRYDGGQIDGQGGGYAAAIIDALRALGWAYAPRYSTCAVASYEARVGKGRQRVEVTTASFLGVFTEVNVWEAASSVEDEDGGI